MWAWLIGAVLRPLFNALASWANAQQTRADEQALGQKTQAVADEAAQVAAATADARKVADVVQAENAALAGAAGDAASLRDPSPDSRD